MNELVVVSRYREDISWVQGSKHPFIIYDKSEVPLDITIPRPNTGREAETLLHYIITHYERLPDITIFLQGDPRGNPPVIPYETILQGINTPHAPIYMPFIDALNISKPDFVSTMWELKPYNYEVALEITALLRGLFNITEYDKPILYPTGVECILPKDNILCRPLEFYKLLHERSFLSGTRSWHWCDPNDLQKRVQFRKYGISAYAFEPLWGAIFNPEIKINKNYKELI